MRLGEVNDRAEPFWYQTVQQGSSARGSYIVNPFCRTREL